MSKISDELIDKATYTNLVAYCQAHGIELKREGMEFVIKSNDSLYISASQPWKWYRHSTGQGGKAIDFAMQYLGLPFRDAVFEMLGKLPEIEIEPTSKIAYKPNTATNQKRVIAYLCQRRGLDYKLVTELIRNGKLRQDTNGNCVFNIFDKSGELISAELHGTGETRFKGQASPQDGYGFEFLVGDSVEWCIYMESAIDLLSFYQLFKDQIHNTLLVSLGGIGKTSVIEHYLNSYPHPKVKHCLAIDNDKKADVFAHDVQIEHEYNGRKYIGRKIPDAKYKDWNDQLLDKPKD